MQNMSTSTKSNLITLPAECKKVIFLHALFQGGRLFVGAICVLYFLSFGLESKDYAWIKTTQAIIFIGLDIPLGYFLSKLGEFKSLLIAAMCGLVGALGYLVCTSFLGFLISEIFLALSISIWPIARSAYAMRILESYKTEGIVEKFFHLEDAVSNLFIVMCGSLGGLLYAFNKFIPYSCFLLFYLAVILCSLIFLRDLGSAKTERKMNLKLLISNVKEIRSVLPFVTILFLVQFFMQPLFHYWQPLFGEKFSISSHEMSIVFISYSLAMTTISWGFSRLTHISILRSSIFAVSAAVIGSVIYTLIAHFDTFSLSLAFFALSFAILNLVQIAGSVLIQNKLNHQNRMIITKYVAFVARIGMIISLVVLHFLFSNNWGIVQVYKLYGALALIVFCFYFCYIVQEKIRRKKHVFEPTG